MRDVQPRKLQFYRAPSGHEPFSNGLTQFETHRRESEFNGGS